MNDEVERPVQGHERHTDQKHSDLRRTRASLFYLVAYLFPLSAGLLIFPTGTFHLLGSRAEHATTAWRLFGGLLLILAMLVVRLIRKRLSAAYINTAIGRLAFVVLFSLPRREDRKPSIPDCSHSARFRRGVDADRPCA